MPACLDFQLRSNIESGWTLIEWKSNERRQ